MNSPALPRPRFPSLHRWERWGLYLLGISVLAFGILVEKRSAFMQRRMTDLGVYLRAGWAVQTGHNIYDIEDNNGWHYQYPPLFAILMVPFADPPPDEPAGAIPYPILVAMWYLFNLFCLAWAVHHLALALEDKAAEQLGERPPPGCRRWWALRVLPILACLPPVGHSLMRGQVNMLLLALLAGMAAAMVRGHKGRAGLWLSGAICLKVIPAFLLIVPLWRRDGRFLLACAFGLILGLGIIPVLLFGPERAWTYYLEYDQKLLRPGLGKGTDQSRAKELTTMNNNDSQSILAALHNSQYPNRLLRPPHPTDTIRMLAYGISAALTIFVFWTAGSIKNIQGPRLVLFLGALILVMILLSPVCHLHYFCLAIPLFMALLDMMWRGRTDPSWSLGLILLVGANIILNAIPHFPAMDLLREVALALYPALALLMIACVFLATTRKTVAIVPSMLTENSKQAA